MQRLAPFPGFPEPDHKRRPHFHALARAIIFQQLAGKAAETIHGRVVALTPGASFPTPREVLELPDERLRGAGLSRNKLLALRDLANKVHSGELDLARIARRGDQHVIDALVTVRGIGEWSAQMFLMFRLGRLDVMPCADLGIQEGLRRLDGLPERPKPKEVLARSTPWRPLASVASWYLWRLTEDKTAS